MLRAVACFGAPEDHVQHEAAAAREEHRRVLCLHDAARRDVHLAVVRHHADHLRGSDLLDDALQVRRDPLRRVRRLARRHAVHEERALARRRHVVHHGLTAQVNPDVRRQTHQSAAVLRHLRLHRRQHIPQQRVADLSPRRHLHIRPQRLQAPLKVLVLYLAKGSTSGEEEPASHHITHTRTQCTS